MKTFVLVHGGMRGGWMWKRVTPFLRAAGHEVYTPTLTGLGERSHLASPQIGLTYISRMYWAFSTMRTYGALFSLGTVGVAW